MEKLRYSVAIRSEVSDWIINRCARELAIVDGCSLNPKCGAFDIYYHMPYTVFQPERAYRHAAHVGLFTHLESESSGVEMQRKREKFLEYSEILIPIALSKQTESVLGKKCEIIKPGVSFRKKIRFGVCGKVHKSGRKNEAFIAQLVRDGYDVVAWGLGWPCKIVSRDYSEIEKFYRSIDYLIVPSAIEGGPVPVLEAIAMGVPVIAPDVGWCWEYPVIRYKRNDYKSLLATCRRLSKPPTWDDWRKRHIAFFNRVGDGDFQT